MDFVGGQYEAGDRQGLEPLFDLAGGPSCRNKVYNDRLLRVMLMNGISQDLTPVISIVD